MDEVLEISYLIKDVFPDTPVVLGGPHATFAYEELMETSFVDYVIRGEGESKLPIFWST